MILKLVKENIPPPCNQEMQQVIYKKYLGFMLLVIKKETEKEEKEGCTELHVHKGWSLLKNIGTRFF